MDDLTCGICLEQLKIPVCTPCGHLCCEACLTSYIEASADAMNASCPTCRTPFSIAIPDLRFVPRKYHGLLMPSVRRVFINTDSKEGPSQSGATDPRRELLTQVANLSQKVTGLEHDKALLMDRCESAIHASHVHAQGERDERVRKEQLEQELRELRKKYESVKSKYKVLKASQENGHPMKRKSVSSPDHDHIQSGVLAVGVRPMLHIPKRPRLLGSPFDLSKRIATRTKSAMLIDEDEEGDLLLRESDLSSSIGPQRSGLPAGDIFSPRHPSVRGGNGSINYGVGPRGLHPTWLLSPEDELPVHSLA